MVTFKVQATGPIFEDPGLAASFDHQIIMMLADVGAYAQRLVVDKAPTGATFNLRGSIVSELHGSPATRVQEVSSSVAYAPIQEVGRRPGRRPPASALLVWVTRKLQVAPDQAPSVAFLVARKIGREGTTGYRFFEQAFEQASPYFERQAEILGANYAAKMNG
jgi:hypothetical protein